MSIKLKHFKHHRIISKIRIRKRATIILSVSLLLISIAIGAYFLSQQIWGDYETGYNRHFDNAKTDIDSVILQTSTESEANSMDKLNSIAQIHTKLTGEVTAYCEVNSLIKWQSFVKQYSDKINDCERKKELLNQLLIYLGETVGYLKAEQELTAIILRANTETNQNNQVDKWSEIEAFWRQAIVDTSKLTDTDQFNSTKTIVISNLTKVADAWQELSSANQAENRQQFEEAHSNLDLAYDSLAEISDNSDVEVKKLISDLNNSYEAAF
ncbi:MAG TPA: hypothetical protein VFD55_02790 [Candidatus Angelobacter sp.]|nr:hypothetical protein [Candidatus Angelobacter sp.]